MIWELISVTIVRDLSRILVSSVNTALWLGSSSHQMVANPELQSKLKRCATSFGAGTPNISPRSFFLDPVGETNSITGCSPLRSIADYRYRTTWWFATNVFSNNAPKINTCICWTEHWALTQTPVFHKNTMAQCFIIKTQWHNA